MDEDLCPWLVQLLDDLLDAVQCLRLAQQHQRILVGIGLDHGVASEVGAQVTGARRAIQALAHLTQHVGKLLGVTVLQAHHTPVLRGGGCRHIQRTGQLCQALPGLGRAEDQQAATVGVGHHLHTAVRPPAAASTTANTASVWALCRVTSS